MYKVGDRVKIVKDRKGLECVYIIWNINIQKLVMITTSA